MAQGRILKHSFDKDLPSWALIGGSNQENTDWVPKVQFSYYREAKRIPILFTW